MNTRWTTRLVLVSGVLGTVGAARWGATSDRSEVEAGAGITRREVPVATRATFVVDAVSGTGHGEFSRAEGLDEAVLALLQSGRLKAAQSWLELVCREGRFSPESLDTVPVERVARALAAESPPEAIAWLRTLPPSRATALGFANVGAAWADRDPVAAMGWVEGLLPEEGREAAMERTFARWADKDFDGAARWVAAHETAPEADRLIVRLLEVSLLAEAQPSVAATWAGLIRDEPMRLGAIEGVLRAWSQRHATEACRYVGENDRLTVAQKETLLRAIAPPPSTGSEGT